MPPFYDLMKYAKTGIASPEMTAYDKMRAVAMAGGKVKTLTGVPPLSFKSNGKPLISWSMKGSGQQNGTPAPDVPIYPYFVGNMAENLFDVSTAEGTEYYINYLGLPVIGADGDRFIAQKVSVLPLTKYTFSWGDTIVGTDNNSPYIRVSGYDDTQFLSRIAYKCTDYVNKTFTITTDQDTTLLDIRYDSSTSLRKQTITNLMFNAGSTAKPYEPYGYKIPITCAGQTTPIYLGQTQTVRKIGKLVLNGQESGWLNQYVSTVFELGFEDATILGVESFSSHYVFNPIQSGIASGLTNGEYALKYFSNGTIIYIKDQLYTTVESWKSYLAQQYSAGTPVTIWYVLATPETAIVNEPLAKIGNYADTLHSTDAGVSIPTVKGANTLTVDTELQPSEMTITYRE